LRIYFIKPSRYDDEGFVLLYRWGVIPNNTLIVLAGLAEAYARAHPEIDLQTVLWDEMVDGLLSADVIASIAERSRDDGTDLLIGLAGVQTNQYPRARDLALQCRALDLTVVMGGFHVSSHAPTRAFLHGCNVSVVVGESDQTLVLLLDDFRRGALRPLYQVTDGIRAKTGLADITVPRIENAPLPMIDDRYVSRFFNPTFSTLDTSRGCPFTCSYCSVKNVMGRTMRSRDATRVVEWVRDAYDNHGIRNLLVVDDDFFRSPEWEPILSGVAALRATRPTLALVLQTDIEAAAYALPVPGETENGRHRRSRRFVDLAAAAGCFEVFMGFESFDPANLEHTQKFHNEDHQDRHRGSAQNGAALERVTSRYRRVVEAWHRAGVGVHCGYMIGLPFDRPGCGKTAARALTEIGVDIASFFVHTPFPGTEDYERAVAESRLTSDDFNLYDSTHCVQTHGCMSREQIEQEYADAYRHFYTWRRLAWSLATFYRVPGLTTATRSGMLTQQFYFTYATRRGMHPMIGGIGRLLDPDGQRQALSDADAAGLYLGQRAVAA
jgi:radical SAM superfamily enzyme YgiQ (UPF0313 family)